MYTREYRCTVCNHKFSKLFKSYAESEANVPQCEKCGGKVKKLISAGKTDKSWGLWSRQK